MRRYDLISSLIWLLVAAFIIFGSLQLPIGSWGNPDAGFMPLLIGLLIAAISFLLFIHTLQQKISEEKPSWEMKNLKSKVTPTIMALLVYNFFLSSLGNILTTFLVMGYLFKYVSQMNWKSSLAFAILTSLVQYLLFEVWLKVQFPRGLLGV